MALFLSLCLASAPAHCSSPSLQELSTQELGAPSRGEVRVVDAESGEPIAGAQVFGVAEVPTPLWGRFWSSAQAECDDEGRALLSVPTKQAPFSWLLVTAPGYAPYGDMTAWALAAEPVEVSLERALPSRVRLVDFRGMPLAGVHLGLCVGCGHTPDVASWVTDPEGRATLMAVGASGGDIADIYPVGATVLTDYLNVDWQAAMRAEQTVRAVPGGVIEGTVLLPNGEPAQGLGVGWTNRHRGPWAISDHRGRFRLFGVPAQTVTYLTLQDAAGNLMAGIDGAYPGVHRLFRMPADLRTDERDHLAPASLRLLVRVLPSDWPLEPYTGRIPVRLWDTTTGWANSYIIDPGAPLEAQLREGTYEVVVGGLDSAFERRHLGTIELVAGEDARQLETVLAAPQIYELWVPEPSGHDKVWLHSAAESSTVLDFDAFEDHSAVLGPGAEKVGVVRTFGMPTEPFGIWVEGEGGGSDEVLLRLEAAPHDPRVLIARVDEEFAKRK